MQGQRIRYRSNVLVGTLTHYRPTLRNDLESVARAVVGRRWTRALANQAYHALSLTKAAAIHEAFGNIFKERKTSVPEGIWAVRFCGRKIRVPLRADSLGLDWGIALALVGHDVEVKQTYIALLKSATPPDLFVDVGSNFGTHSILFQARGISTISFDPNPGCNAYHRRLAAANGLQPRIEPMAIGEQTGRTNLAYPPDAPWLGSTDVEIGKDLKTHHDLETCEVEQTIVDAYLSEFQHRRVLMKIDTEGNEHAVLRGAAETLRVARPLVVFECWSGPRRVEIHRLLASLEYGVAPLPWNADAAPRHLSVEQFCDCVGTNFLASPLKNS